MRNGQAPGPGQQENCETMNLTDDQLDWGVHTRLELERRSILGSNGMTKSDCSLKTLSVFSECSLNACLVL